MSIDHSQRVDVVTLARLAKRMREDIDSGFSGLSAPMVRSIVDIIEGAIGTPLRTPMSEDGAAAADEMFPGNPSARLGFNTGVAWAVQQMPTRVRLREPEYAEANREQNGTSENREKTGAENG